MRLVWHELAEEFREDKPYSTFLLLLGLEVLLVFSGAAFLYSNSNSYMLERHLIWLGLGLTIGLIIYFLPIRMIVQCIPYFAVLAIVLNILPQFSGLQLANDGSPRWIRLWGYSFQVSETLRLMLILYFARHISIELLKYQKWLKEGNSINKQLFTDYCPKVLWRPLFYLLIACFLVILQKDYSTTALLLVAASAMVLLVGSWRTFSLIVMILSGITLIAIMYLGQTFRRNRISEWLEGSGEQINWVYDALQNGSWFGIGLGQGRAKHLVPVEMTDFPLVAVGEETGFLGIFLIFCLFLAFVIVGFSLARQNQVPFVRYATAGLTGLIFMQAFVNFSVSSGILPVTGQPLPFFSVGGSSTLTYLVILGLINSLNRPSRNLRSEGGLPPSNRSAGKHRQVRVPSPSNRRVQSATGKGTRWQQKIADWKVAGGIYVKSHLRKNRFGVMPESYPQIALLWLASPWQKTQVVLFATFRFFLTLSRRILEPSNGGKVFLGFHSSGFLDLVRNWLSCVQKYLMTIFSVIKSILLRNRLLRQSSRRQTNIACFCRFLSDKSPITQVGIRLIVRVNIWQQKLNHQNYFQKLWSN